MTDRTTTGTEDYGYSRTEDTDSNEQQSKGGQSAWTYDSYKHEQEKTYQKEEDKEKGK